MSSAAKRPILRTLSPVVGSSRESIFISCRIRPSTRLCTTPGGRFYTNTHCSGSAANTKLEAKRSIPLTTCQHPVVKGSHTHNCWSNRAYMSTSTSTSTMKALVYKGEGQCALEDRPIPQVQEPTDAVVKGKSPPDSRNRNMSLI